MIRKLLALATAAVVASSNFAFVPGAFARSAKREFTDFVSSAMEPSSKTIPATGTVEYAFSPREGAEALVVKVIRSSHKSIRLMAYSLTSAPVVSALIEAKKRGVDVAAVVDYKENITADRSGKSRAALGALANAGIAVRTIDVYSIAHDKVLIVDAETVETGSFNYTAAAAKSNSENVIVMWKNPQLATGYLAHWERNWRQGRDWHPGY